LNRPFFKRFKRLFAAGSFKNAPFNFATLKVLCSRRNTLPLSIALWSTRLSGGWCSCTAATSCAPHGTCLNPIGQKERLGRLPHWEGTYRLERRNARSDILSIKVSYPERLDQRAHSRHWIPALDHDPRLPNYRKHEPDYRLTTDRRLHRGTNAI
jgi:hypothetical protein